MNSARTTADTDAARRVGLSSALLLLLVAGLSWAFGAPPRRVASGLGAAALADRAEQWLAPKSGPLPGSALELFQARCARCHGPRGRGDGPDAAVMLRPPRDLHVGPYKFKSTRLGQPPARRDLLRTVLAGLPGTGMDPQPDLDPAQAWALVALLEKWITGGRSLPDAEVLEVPPPPARYLPDQGRQAWRVLKCWDCHGYTGAGDGPSAFSLTDVRGRPAVLPDFTRSMPLRSGARPQDLYRTIALGLEGTPMPGHADNAAPETLWSAVFYLLELKK